MCYNRPVRNVIAVLEAEICFEKEAVPKTIGSGEIMTAYLL